MASGGFASDHNQDDHNQDCPWTSLGDFRPQRPGPLVSHYIPATAFYIKDDCYGI